MKVKETGRELRLEKWKISDLKPYENNPRVIDDAIPEVAESIRQVGYNTPIVVDENGEVLAGHTRLAALKSLGTTETEVLVVTGLTEDQKIKYRLLDNKTGELARWDYDLLQKEMVNLDIGTFSLDLPAGKTAGTEAGADGSHDPVRCPVCGEVVG